jgi:hypothetical protein
MRGAERPAKVHWTRPFLTPLKPLTYEAARQTFIDIADDFHNKKDVDQLLRFTDNLPLAVDLVAHLVDYEGCPAVLARWKTEKTSMLSSGYDRVSSLDASISLSLASPRITSLPSSKDLLSLLSILPDGLSEIILVQSNLPIKHILTCKTALLRTSLAYIDDKGRLKLLVPIREHVHSLCSPSWTLVQPLQKYFSIVLEFHYNYYGHLSDVKPVAQITSNLANIENILLLGFQSDNPDLKEIVISSLHLNEFTRINRYGRHLLMDQTPGNTTNRLILDGTYVSYIPPKMRRKRLPWKAPSGLFHPLHQAPVLEPKPNFSTCSIGFGGPVKLSVKFVTH